MSGWRACFLYFASIRECVSDLPEFDLPLHNEVKVELLKRIATFLLIVIGKIPPEDCVLRNMKDLEDAAETFVSSIFY